MKAYVVYEIVTKKEIEIPDKFAPLVGADWSGIWSEEAGGLWRDLDDYADSKDFLNQCDFDGTIRALEAENGEVLLEW